MMAISTALTTVRLSRTETKEHATMPSVTRVMIQDNDGVDADEDDDDFDNSVCKDDDNDGCNDCSVRTH